MLSWFDANPDRYWLFACICTVLPILIILRPILRQRRAPSGSADWWWSLVIFFMLCAGRWPTWFVPRQFNEDESLLIAGAMTLRHDPVFFRAVDGGTAGPLDFYALLPIGWLHGADDFASARFTAMVLVGLALVFAHQSLSRLINSQTARVATFGAVYMESFTLSPDLLHYSTELVSVVLLSFALFAGIRRFSLKESIRWNIAGGLALGLVPFAKLQAAPIGLLLGVIWIVCEIRLSERSDRRVCITLAALCGSALIPLTLCSVMLAVTGEWKNAVIPYILHNLEYTNSVYIFAPGLTKLQTLVALFQVASTPGNLFAAWTVGSATWLLLAFAFARTPSKQYQIVTLVVAVMLVVSTLCILATHRPFLHYAQLVVIPGTLLFGLAIGLSFFDNEKRPFHWHCGILCGTLLCSVGPSIYERAENSFNYFGTLEALRTHPQGIVAAEISKYTTIGEPLAVWGWLSRCYVETGLRQATRNCASVHEIEPGKYRDYYRRRYLADLQSSFPPVFVDAVGSENFYFNDRSQAHDQSFPELADFVKLHYILVADVNTSRIFVRKDRLASRLPTQNFSPQNAE